jgi:hypothetical protein
MLGNRKHDPSPRLDRSVHLREYVLIRIYVLQYIESPNHPELSLEGNLTRVELEEFDIRDTHSRVVQATGVQLGARQAEVRKRITKPFEHEASAAADLE